MVKAGRFERATKIKLISYTHTQTNYAHEREEGKACGKKIIT